MQTQRIKSRPIGTIGESFSQNQHISNCRSEIDDASAVKPEDWDESQPKTVVDENAQKPSDWNEDEPELIPDPEASKPADWDVDIDGDWEPPLIDNVNCKGLSGCGPWKQPTIPNPLYKV